MTKGFWRQLIEANGTVVARLLRQLARQVELAAPGPPLLGFIVWHQLEGVTIMDLQVLDTSSPLSAAASFLDVDGNPTAPDDVPVWASSDESVATVEAAADGLSAVVTLTTALGATVISCDSTRSSDGVDVHLAATLTVAASEETSGEIILTPSA
jgi:hypothetical protein